MEPTRVSRLGAMLSKVTPSLTLACFVTALLNLLFGFDTTSFAGVQSIPAFERQFGTPTGPDGEYELSGARASFVSSIGFLGKFCGTLVRRSLNLSLPGALPQENVTYVDRNLGLLPIECPLSDRTYRTSLHHVLSLHGQLCRCHNRMHFPSCSSVRTWSDHRILQVRLLNNAYLL